MEAKSAVNPLKALFLKGKTENYDKSEVILMPGKYSNDVYMVKSGYVKSYTIDNDGRYNLLTIQAESDLFPLHIVFDNDENDVFYEAMTSVTLLKIDKLSFRQALNKDNSLAFTVLKESVDALGYYSQRLRNLELSDARDRIIYRLIYLSNLFGLPSKDDHIVINMPLNYQDLADSLNMTRETANREVRKLERLGWIKKTRNYLVILNERALESALELKNSPS